MFVKLLRLSSEHVVLTDGSFSSTYVEDTGVLQGNPFNPSPIMVKGKS